jgi:hypothetical protein
VEVNMGVTIESVYQEINTLTLREKMLIVSKILAEIPGNMITGKKVSIMDIRGVGKDVWEGKDAQEYVNGERDSWK